MPRYSASLFAGIRWSDPVTLPLHVGSAAAGAGGGAEEDLATGGAPSLSMTPSAKRTRFSPFRRSFPPRGRFSGEEEGEERHGRRDAGSSEAGASSSRLGLAKRRREKRTREPESAMAVAAASAPMDEEEEEEEDMVVVVAGWVSVEGWLAGRWLT